MCQSARNVDVLLSNLVDPVMNKILFGKPLLHQKKMKELKAIVDSGNCDANRQKIVQTIRALMRNMRPEVVEIFVKEGSDKVLDHLGLHDQREFHFIKLSQKGDVLALQELLTKDGTRRSRLVDAFHNANRHSATVCSSYDWLCYAILEPAIKHMRWDVLKYLFDYALEPKERGGCDKNSITSKQEHAMRQTLVKSVAGHLVLDQLTPSMIKTLATYFHTYNAELAASFLVQLLQEHAASSVCVCETVQTCALELLGTKTLTNLLACAHSIPRQTCNALTCMLPKTVETLLWMDSRARKGKWYENAYLGAPRLTIVPVDQIASIASNMTCNAFETPVSLSSTVKHSCVSIPYLWLMQHYKTNTFDQRESFGRPRALTHMVQTAWASMLETMHYLQDAYDKHQDLPASNQAAPCVLDLCVSEQPIRDCLSTLQAMSPRTNSPSPCSFHEIIDSYAWPLLERIVHLQSAKIVRGLLTAWAQLYDQFGVQTAISPTLRKTIVKKLKVKLIGQQLVDSVLQLVSTSM